VDYEKTFGVLVPPSYLPGLFSLSQQKMLLSRYFWQAKAGGNFLWELTEKQSKVL
jgi:hypothetical protein